MVSILFLSFYSDSVSDEVIGTHFIDLSRISNDGANGMLAMYFTCIKILTKLRQHHPTLFVCAIVCLSVRLSSIVCPTVRLSSIVCLTVCPSVCLSIFYRLCCSQSVCTSVCLSVCPLSFVLPSVRLCVCPLSLCVWYRSSVRTTLRLSVCLLSFVLLSVCTSVSVLYRYVYCVLLLSQCIKVTGLSSLICYAGRCWYSFV